MEDVENGVLCGKWMIVVVLKGKERWGGR